MSTAQTYRQAFDNEMGFDFTSSPAAIDARIRYYMGDQVADGDLPQEVYNALTPILTGPTGRRFGVNLCRRFVAGLNALLNVDGVRPLDPADIMAIKAGDEARRQMEALVADGQPVPPELAAQVATAEQLAGAADWVWQRCVAADWAVTWNRIQTMASVAGVGYVVCGYGADKLPTFYVNAPLSDENGDGVLPGEVDDEGRLVTAEKRYTWRRYVDTQTGALVTFMDWLLARIGIIRRRDAVRAEDWRVRILYEPDRIRRFVTPQGGRERLANPDTDGIDPEMPWAFSRIPVIAFTSPVGNEIDDVLPLQQLLNHAVLSLQHLSLVQGFPVTWTVDADVAASTSAADTSHASDGRRTSGTSGDTPQIAAGPGSLLSVDTRNGYTGQAKIERMEAADLGPQMEAVKLYGDLAAWINGYPPAWLPWNATGTPPSGEALKQLMSPMLDKAELYQEQHTPQLTVLFGLLQEMGGRRRVELAPVWRETEFWDINGLAALLPQMQAAGVDPETMLDLLPLKAEQKERALAYIEQIEADRAQRVTANLADLMAQDEPQTLQQQEVPGG